MRGIPFRLGLALLALTVGAGGAAAQEEVEITTQKLTGTLYMLTGQGGNIGVSAGADGVYLIDDQFAPLTEKIQAAVAAISAGPIRFVVNTHWHFDHTGGNENFGEAGAIIVAHDNVRVRMEKGQEMPAFNSTIPPAPEAALPVLTFSEETTLHLNGEPAHVIHVAPAHTDGDAIVHWPQSNVIHTGDVFFNGFYPFIDAWSGGGIDGMIAACEKVLALADEKTQIIPGHGPLGTREDLMRFRDMLVTVRDRARAARAGGKSVEEWVAGKPLADLDAEWGKGSFSGERFAEIVWAGLGE